MYICVIYLSIYLSIHLSNYLSVNSIRTSHALMRL